MIFCSDSLFVQFELVGINVCGVLWSVFIEEVVYGVDVVVEYIMIDWYCVFYVYYELDVRCVYKLIFVSYVFGFQDMVQVEGFDFWFDVVGQYFVGQLVYQIRWVFVNMCWEIV